MHKLSVSDLSKIDIYIYIVIGFAFDPLAMGKPLNKRLVAAYAKAFKQFPVLRERGFSIMVHSDSLSMCS